MALLYPQTQWFDNNGDPLASGKIYTYQAGTSTPQSTYTDSTGGVANANPLVLDAQGRGVMWMLSSPNYKIIVKDSDDVQVGSTLDNVTGLGTTLDSFTTLQSNLDTNNYSIVTTASNYDITLDPNGTGNINLNGQVLAANGITLGGGISATTSISAGTTLGCTGNFAVNTNKFNVTAASGNTTVAGTLGVTGDVAVNTNKFNVTAASGNTTVAGTLDVTGVTSLNGNANIGTTAGTATIKSSNTTPASLILQTNSGANTSTIKSDNAQASNLSWTLPSSAPAHNSSVILASTAGVLSTSAAAYIPTQLVSIATGSSGSSNGFNLTLDSSYSRYRLILLMGPNTSSDTLVMRSAVASVDDTSTNYGWSYTGNSSTDGALAASSGFGDTSIHLANTAYTNVNGTTTDWILEADIFAGGFTTMTVIWKVGGYGFNNVSTQQFNIAGAGNWKKAGVNQNLIHIFMLSGSNIAYNYSFMGYVN